MESTRRRSSVSRACDSGDGLLISSCSWLFGQSHHRDAVRNRYRFEAPGSSGQRSGERFGERQNGKCTSNADSVEADLQTDQVMGLALSLRRLDLIEMIYRASRSPSKTASSSKRPLHDESLIRYVLHEVLSGYGGHEDLPRSFMMPVSRIVYQSPQYALTSTSHSAL